MTLAKRLVDMAPAGLTRVFYSDNGSTAVEVALKMALQFWQQADGGAQKQRQPSSPSAIAYHGDTIGSVSLGGIDLFHERYRPLLFQTIQAPSPYCYRCPLQSSVRLRAAASRRWSERARPRRSRRSCSSRACRAPPGW